MKKTFLKTLVAMMAISTCVMFASCKDDDDDKNEPIDVSVENPRYITYADGNIYFTCYYPMAVVRFDPSQKAITGICKLGQYHPEGIAAVGDKLYIASSNISDENYNYHYDNKLYIVDISSMQLVDSVTVGRNPDKVKKLDDNHIVFNTLGDYNSDQGGLYIMNTTQKEITQLSKNLYNFDVYNGNIYGYTSPYSSFEFYKIDGTTHSATMLNINWTGADAPYGIAVDPSNGNIVITSNGNYTSTGDCYVYTENAQGGAALMDAVEVGNLPSKIGFIGGDNLLVLNEGAWGANNAGVSKVNVANATAVVNFFADNNGRGLGDVAQDMLVVNGKAYITVTFSNSLEIMDVATGQSTRFATAK